MFINIFWELFL